MRAYLLLGGNVGDVRATFAAVPPALRSRSIVVTGASRIFETEPVGGPSGQPAFLNQALEVSTMCSLRELFDATTAIEFAHGRRRDMEEQHGPRTLDIDILVTDGPTASERDLVVPHPRLHERPFALIPLGEIAPELEIPGHGTVASLLVGFGDTSGVRLAAG